jgi:hypothetical protein
VDPAALYIACANNLTVLINQCEQVVRSACTTLPLLGEKGHDIRSQTLEMAAAMVAELQHDASVLGVSVQRVCIVEARYAQEIAAQMLMKQQATAMVDARKGACGRTRAGGGWWGVERYTRLARNAPACVRACPQRRPFSRRVCVYMPPLTPHPTLPPQPSWRARWASCATRSRSSPRCRPRRRSGWSTTCSSR